MSRFGSQYQIARPTGVCASSGEPLEPGTPCIASICERSEDDSFDRLDFSVESWDQGARPDRLYSYWRTTVPEPNERRQLLVDDEVLFDLFVRLGEDDQEQRRAFRFVLALILMRKRQLKFLGRESREDEAQPVNDDAGNEPATTEYWKFRSPGPATDEDFETYDVLNPQLSDDDVRELTGQLSEILQSEI